MLRLLGFQALANHLNHVAQTAYRAEVDMTLHQIGSCTRDNARNSLGVYQSGIAGFPAWGPLQPSTLAKKAQMGWGRNGDPDTPLFATGELEQAIEYAVTGPSTVEVGTNNQKAAYLEIGRVNMAPRPIFGPAAFRTLPHFRTQLGVNLAAAIAGVRVTSYGGANGGGAFTP